MVNDCGRREAASGGVSDRAAAERVGKTGRTEMYWCNFGRGDIAVPVICDGAHIATLYSGQVLREAPGQKEPFLQILRELPPPHRPAGSDPTADSEPGCPMKSQKEQISPLSPMLFT